MAPPGGNRRHHWRFFGCYYTSYALLCCLFLKTLIPWCYTHASYLVTTVVKCESNRHGAGFVCCHYLYQPVLRKSISLFIRYTLKHGTEVYDFNLTLMQRNRICLVECGSSLWHKKCVFLLIHDRCPKSMACGQQVERQTTVGVI